MSLSGFVYKDYFVCFCLFRFSIALYGLVCPFDHLQLTRILNRNFKAYQLQRQRKAKSENIRGLTQIMVTPSLSNVVWVVISYQILTCFSSQSVKYLVMEHYCHFTDVSLYKSKQHFTRNQYIHEWDFRCQCFKMRACPHSSILQNSRLVPQWYCKIFVNITSYKL